MTQATRSLPIETDAEPRIATVEDKAGPPLPAGLSPSYCVLRKAMWIDWD